MGAGGAGGVDCKGSRCAWQRLLKDVATGVNGLRTCEGNGMTSSSIESTTSFMNDIKVEDFEPNLEVEDQELANLDGRFSKTVKGDDDAQVKANLTEES